MPSFTSSTSSMKRVWMSVTPTPRSLSPSYSFFCHQVEVLEVGVLEREVDLLDGQAQHLGVDLLDLAVADVGVELGVDAVDGRVHRLDGEVEVLVRARVDGGLVDLDVLRAGLDQRLDLAADDLRHVEDGVAARRVVLVERPLDHRVGAGEHAFDGPIGEALRVLATCRRSSGRARRACRR